MLIVIIIIITTINNNSNNINNNNNNNNNNNSTNRYIQKGLANIHKDIKETLFYFYIIIPSITRTHRFIEVIFVSFETISI